MSTCEESKSTTTLRPTADETANETANELQSSTKRILDLIRGLSDADVSIPGKPDVSYIMQKLCKFTEERRATHMESQRYFDRQNALFFWPSIALTSLTSGFSFLATQFPDTGTVFNVGIGLMSVVSTLIVALSETYRYGAKAEQHGLAAESYENLRTKLYFKSLHLKASQKRLDPCEVSAFFVSIEDQITEISRQCKDLVPSKIVKEYKEKRLKILKENLDRNIETLKAQVRYNDVVERVTGLRDDSSKKNGFEADIV